MHHLHIDKKPFTLIGVILILAAVLVFFSFCFHKNNQYLLLWQNCKSSNLDTFDQCLQRNISALINKSPEKTDEIFTSFAALARTGQIAEDLRIIFPSVHLAGMILADKKIDLPLAFKYCGFTFKYGCIHGYVMEKLEHSLHQDEYLKLCDESYLTKKINEIQYNNCVHGIGHFIAVISKENINKTLDKCRILENGNEHLSACISGIFMEYSTEGKLGRGHHSKKRAGQFSLPCSEIEMKYQAICYASEASYRQYFPGKETFQHTYKYCGTLSKEFQIYCNKAVDDRSAISKGYKFTTEI